MSLFAGMILVYGIYSSSAQSGPIFFDPRLLEHTTPKIQLFQQEFRTTAAVQNDEGVNGESNDNDNDNNSAQMEWECGVDYLTKLISESKIQSNCPQLKTPINQCCIAHDTCYDEQHGRKFCDDTFCNCLNVATRFSRICSKRDGPSFCEIVRSFGEHAYFEAGKEKAIKNTSPKVHLQNTTR
ncbi:Phospholipase A2-like protein [Dirofilaria immitis]